jgi:hypothetical protein
MIIQGSREIWDHARKIRRLSQLFHDALLPMTGLDAYRQRRGTIRFHAPCIIRRDLGIVQVLRMEVRRYGDGMLRVRSKGHFGEPPAHYVAWRNANIEPRVRTGLEITELMMRADSLGFLKNPGFRKVNTVSCFVHYIAS